MGLRAAFLNFWSGDRSAAEPPPRPEPGHVQNYHGSIGNLFNIDVGDSGDLGLLLSGPASEKEALAPTLIDRVPQTTALLERLIEIEAPDRGSSLLVLVPGCVSDLHNALVLRCAKVDFVRATANGDPWLYLKQLEWPEGAVSVDPILKSIGDELALGKSSRRPQIEAQVAALARNICFSHLIDGPLWEQDEGALLGKWVDYFLSGALRPSPGHLLVSFVCVQYEPERTAACRKLEAFVGALAERQLPDGVAVLTTPVLNPILQRHLAQWVSKAATFLEDELVETELLDLPASVFGANPMPRPFADVYKAVREALARTVRHHRPQFMEIRR